MNRSFCCGCSINDTAPKCAIKKAPCNACIDDIIENRPLNLSENFVCHKTAQKIEAGKLIIGNKCDDCGLCYIVCPHTRLENINELFNARLEKVVLTDFSKSSILFQVLFPKAVVAPEVQVKGNFRTKRIDLLIKNGTNIYLIKALKNTDKIPFYSRSYIDVIKHYNTVYPQFNFSAICLVPASKLSAKAFGQAVICNINTLYNMIGGN